MLGDYHALIIGNNDYRHLPKLETAVNDATALAALLEKDYGFAVKRLLNADKREILRAINEYRAALEPEDSLLIFYAGHGWIDRATNTGFWQPVDAEAEDDLNWIANEELTRRLNGMAARHVMVIADSCYSGTLLRGGSGSAPSGAAREAWLRRVGAKRSRTAIVSGGLEPVEDSGRDGHSVFSNALLDALGENTGILDGQTLFQRISRPVALNADQTPQFSDIRRAGHEGGAFLFQPTRLAPAPPATPAGKRSDEVVFWESIKDGASAVEFEAYIDRFPDGAFVALARSRLAKLTDKTVRAVPPSRAEAKPRAARPGHKECEYCPAMIVVPPGAFTMGSAHRGEGPAHRVVIAEPFAVARLETSFGEWDLCVAAGHCSHRPDDEGWGHDDRPVVHVNRADAVEYVAWLATLTGRDYRLLSEAEWEYAARAGTTTKRYWGEEIGEGRANCWHCGGEGKRTVPVGSYPPNGFALHDMLGNVHEWVADCRSPDYQGAPADGGARRDGDCKAGLTRGGSWSTASQAVTVTMRNWVGAGLRNKYTGFRVARSLGPGDLKEWLAFAESGDPVAQTYLGAIYLGGFGGSDPDFDQARAWFLKAAEQGHAEAQFELGRLLRADDGEAGLGWLRRAAEAGHAPAQRELGSALAEGEAPDLVEAYMWVDLVVSLN